MSDVIRDYIDAPVDDEIVKRREDKVKALAALDAEREAHETLKMKYAMMEKFADDSVKRRAAETEEHAKQIVDLKQRISELEVDERTLCKPLKEPTYTVTSDPEEQPKEE